MASAREQTLHTEDSAARLAAVLPGVCLGLILVGTFLLKLRNLDHAGLHRWDEAYHAVVAQNVWKHPLTPTLIDVPYLPYDAKDWGENHVWLHKPILTFWQIALTFTVLGVNTLALRLPSALLSTGAAWLTYLIGKELLDRRAAWIAAALQAMNPFVVKLVHGYQFADHIDVALLFWVEVGIFSLARLLRTGCWNNVLLAGAAQGLAFLCKSYLAAIIFGVAITAWLLPACGLVKRAERKIDLSRLLGLLSVSALVAGPWLVYSMINFPDEFWHEHTQVLMHLHANVETWGAPWDRVIFDYLIAMYGVFYTPIIVAAVVLAGKALAERHLGLLLVFAWALGVLLPHVFAVSKTPSATLLAMPAMLLLLGYLISEACRADCWPLAALAAIMGASILFPAIVRDPGHGYPRTPGFAAVMNQAMWIVYHVIGALAAAILLVIAGLLARPRLPSSWSQLGATFRLTVILACSIALSLLVYRAAIAAWRVTNEKVSVSDLISADAGRFARDHLPDNAVLLCEIRKGQEHLATMFYADRTCYPLPRDDVGTTARRIIQAGGLPFIVSRRGHPLPPVYTNAELGLMIYRWQEP